MEYRIATREDLESVWDSDIKKHPDDPRWQRWKGEYIGYNENGMATTFVALDGARVVAQVTLIMSPEVKAVLGKPLLCDGKEVANFNAFRCDIEFRGQGHISALVKMAEEYAREKGYKKITIGAEAVCPKNLSIYFHFGYTNFEMFENSSEDGLILYYGKTL